VYLEERLFITSFLYYCLLFISSGRLASNADRPTVMQQLPKPTAVRDDAIFPGASAASFSP